MDLATRYEDQTFLTQRYRFIEHGVKLKKLLIITLVGLGVWQFYFKDSTAVENTKTQVGSDFANSAAMRTLNAAKEIANPKVTYECDGREYCSQMGSYEEAVYFLRHCPNTKMDGDGDGIPCEKQFNK